MSPSCIGRRLFAVVFGIVMFTLERRAFAIFYTNCFHTDFVSYANEPIFVGHCKTELLGAALCSMDVNCDLFSRNENQCLFFKTKNNSLRCQREISENAMMVKFKLYTSFIPEVWTKVGPLYLYMTPDTYTCDKAEEACISIGGTMAEFHNVEEMDNAYTFITESAYVGIDYVNGKYLWKTNRKEVDHILWAPDQPLGEPCVQIWIREYGLDDKFSGIYKQVLCEKRIPI